MKRITLALLALLTGLVVFAQEGLPNDRSSLEDPPEGYVNGLFTVDGQGTKVYFSQGNLQYAGGEWRFAEHQWDILGDNGQGSANEGVSRDLFGWGTSGYSHGATCYQPWSTSNTYSDYYAYGNANYNLYDQTGKADWGYNAISNGGNQLNSGWRTLTYEEWDYLFNTRNPNGIRYAKANVNGVNGVILLPDDWNEDYFPLIDPNTSSANFNSNSITETDWTFLEQLGAVFLPAAGYRSVTLIWYPGSYGHYWSASYWSVSILGGSSAWSLYFNKSNLSNANVEKNIGYSVRLVRPVE